METKKKKLRFSKYLKISNERLIEGISYYQQLVGYTDREMCKVLGEDFHFFCCWREGKCKLKDKCKYKAYEIIVRLVNLGHFDLELGILPPKKEMQETID